MVWPVRVNKSNASHVAVARRHRLEVSKLSERELADLGTTRVEFGKLIIHAIGTRVFPEIRA